MEHINTHCQQRKQEKERKGVGEREGHRGKDTDIARERQKGDREVNGDRVRNLIET
jgi:hypothetical protein